MILPRAIIKNKKTLTTVIRIIISLTLLIVMFRLIDFRDFVQLLATLNLGLYIAGVAFYLLALILSAVRWQLVLRYDGVQVGLRSLIEINLVGMLFTNFLPTAVGGDVARMYEYSRQNGEGTRAVSTVLLDRMFGLASLVLMAVLAMLVGYSFVGGFTVFIVVVMAAIGLPFTWFLFFNRTFMRHFLWVFRLPLLGRVEDQVRRLYRAMSGLQRQKGLVASAILVSFIVQCVEVFSVVLIARALDIQVSVVYFFIFIPIIWLVTMIPLSLNGLGLREGAFTFFFGQVGLSTTKAVALSLLVYSYRIFAGILGGLIFLNRTFRTSKDNVCN